MYDSTIDLLEHIQTELKFIAKAIKNLSLEDFIRDEVLKRAVIRSIEIIGEASKKINPDFKAQHPHVEWKQAARMRDKLIHDYAGVDYALVWDTMKDELPEFEFQIDNLIKQNES